MVTTGRDPLQDSSTPDEHWTTANIGEAMPGVVTPLSWTLFAPAIEHTYRRTMHDMGVFSPTELPWPPAAPGDWITRVFSGRAALNVEALSRLGDRMPGTTGAQVVTDIFGEVPDSMTFAPTRRRYPAVAVGLPRTHLRAPKRLRNGAARTAAWWPGAVQAASTAATVDEATARFSEAADLFFDNVHLQGTALFAVVTPMYDVITKLAERAGVDPTALAAGFGGVPEMALVGGIWECSRGSISLDDLIARYGFHGPAEGELSGRVWREDPGPLLRAVKDYQSKPDSADPRHRTEALQAKRRDLEAAVLASAARPARPLVQALLRHAAATIPLRGVAKDAFLQAFDVARAAARRAGVLYADAGILDDPDDVFFLTTTELRAGLREPQHAVVAERRAYYREHTAVRLPTTWRGMPVPIPLAENADVDLITGTGVSPGTITGRALVVTDPADVEVEDGDILVSATTDPSWASVMFLSSGLVVDIGGPLSHAAVVARELDIPCVVGTVQGSSVIRTGDTIEVDGSAGEVRILDRSHRGQQG